MCRSLLKILFPILNKRLWIAYAQPGYHRFVADILGFRLHSFFDYSFDDIPHPQLRVSELMNVVKPYSTLSKHEWDKIYQEAKETIEYNYQWASSGKFINRLRELNEVK